MHMGMHKTQSHHCAQTVGPNDPEQIHLALGAAGEMYVSWVTGVYVESATPPVTPTPTLKTQVGLGSTRRYAVPGNFTMRMAWRWQAWVACAHRQAAALHAGQVRAAAGEAGPAGKRRGGLLYHQQHRHALRSASACLRW